ncbi:hypothetical protein Tco_0452137 [Tanacetum coccineum]
MRKKVVYLKVSDKEKAKRSSGGENKDEENDVDKENDELRLYLTIAQDEEKEVDYEILDRKYPIKEWKTECLGAKPQTDQAEHLEEINLNVVIRSNGQKRYFSTLMTVLSIFDREDLNAVYQMVMEKYQDEMPEGFDRVLWGDLMVLFNSDDKDEFWSSQLDWIIVSWKLHSSSGVHTLVTDTGLVIHMLVEKKYPLRKEVLMQMLKLKLESEEENTMALELIKFVKKILAELEPKEHKNWLVHKQTACGKDFSNPFMVDNLPKIVGLSTHLASVVKSWLVHDQTVHDDAVHKVLGNNLVRAATTASVRREEQEVNLEMRSLGEMHPNRGEMFDVDALDGEEVFVAGQNENVVEEVVDVAQVTNVATAVTLTTKEITLAQALATLKTSKPKVKGIVFQNPSTTTTTTTISSQQSQDKAEFTKEERLAREKTKKEKEANIALIEEWDDIQAKIEVDHEWLKRLKRGAEELFLKNENFFNNS